MRKIGLPLFIWILCTTLACTMFQKTTADQIDVSEPSVVESADQVEQKAMPPKENTKMGMAQITFDTPVKNFGEVVQGQKKPYSFDFTNTGDVPLYIELVTACTCTSIDWPRDPIAPGGRGSIDIVFDSTTKEGEVTVDVDVIANMEPIVSTAVIKAVVVRDDQ